MGNVTYALCGDKKGEKYATAGEDSSSKQSTAFGLTKSDIKLIKEDWSTIENPDLLGQVILMRIFDQKPDVKAAFKFMFVEREDLPSHPKFISHANNFTKFLLSIIESLDRPDELYNKTSHVSDIHTNKAKYEPKVKDEENWNVFYESAMVCVLEAKRTPPIPEERKVKLRIVWQMLMARMVNQIKYSF